MTRKSPSRKELSHAKIVEVAAGAIRRAGYQGVGVADIMKDAGLTHGGFYAHFGSRDALLVEAVEHAGRENLAAIRRHAAELCGKGLSPLAAVVHSYLSDEHLADAEQGCVVAALSSESARQSPEVRRAARASVKALIALVKSALPNSDEATASLVAASMVGALQLARTLDARAGKALLSDVRQALVARHG